MRILFVILFSIFSVIVSAQNDTSIPFEARKFILNDYEVYHYTKGDLNNDGREDAIMILNYATENDSIDSREMIKPFLVLLRNTNNKLHLALRNDSLMPLDMMSCYFGGIEIDKKSNGFSIDFWGGRRDKWTSKLTFSYKKIDKNWHLVLEKQTSFDAAEMKSIKDENYSIKEEELIGITLSNFNYNKVIEKTDAIVMSDSAFFYSQPDKKSNHRKAYLVRGDKPEIISQTKNFVYVYYSNKQGKSTIGFLLKKNLKFTSKFSNK